MNIASPGTGPFYASTRCAGLRCSARSPKKQPARGCHSAGLAIRSLSRHGRAARRRTSGSWHLSSVRICSGRGIGQDQVTTPPLRWRSANTSAKRLDEAQKSLLLLSQRRRYPGFDRGGRDRAPVAGSVLCNSDEQAAWEAEIAGSSRELQGIRAGRLDRGAEPRLPLAERRT